MDHDFTNVEDGQLRALHKRFPLLAFSIALCDGGGNPDDTRQPARNLRRFKKSS
jgi:hypothetical protein